MFYSSEYSHVVHVVETALMCIYSPTVSKSIIYLLSKCTYNKSGSNTK